jgi:methionyl aminopeptidase
MIRIKSPADIAAIRRSGTVLAETIRETRRRVRPGTTTKELDTFVRSQIEARGGRPAQLGYSGYPASLCASVNNEVIHGIPGPRVLREGDIIDLDIVVDIGGFLADASVTLPVGQVSPEREQLLRVARECLYLGVRQARAGNRIRDIAAAVYEHARAHGYDAVRQFCGHGVGTEMHEEPQVPNYPGRGPNPRLKPGMVLAIEPMINAGGWEVEILEDGWTVVTADGSDSAHFEHTVLVSEDRGEILTPWDDYRDAGVEGGS